MRKEEAAELIPKITSRVNLPQIFHTMYPRQSQITDLFFISLFIFALECAAENNISSPDRSFLVRELSVT